MFFSLSKIFWFLAQPLNAICLLALLGAATWMLFSKRAGQMIMGGALALFLVFGILPIGPVLVTWLERQAPRPAERPAQVDGIILLGGAFETAQSRRAGHLVMNGQAGRVFCFADIARAHPRAKLVFSGGAGDILHPEDSEATDAKLFFDMVGLGTREIVYESKSRNTYENAIFSKELLKPQAEEHWLLVTSYYHMPRALGVFQKQGWEVIPYGCDPKTDMDYSFFDRLPGVGSNFSFLTLAIKELIGSIVYYVTGKSAFILPPEQLPSASP